MAISLLRCCPVQLQYADGIASSSTICINGKVSPKSVQRMNHVELSEITRLAAPKTILLGIGIISLHPFLYEPSDLEERSSTDRVIFVNLYRLGVAVIEESNMDTKFLGSIRGIVNIVIHTYMLKI